MRGFLLFLIVLPLSILGQGTARTLLWRIQGPATTRTSYLYGTFHSEDPRVFQFGDSVLPALYRSDLMAGELDMNDVKGMNKDLMSAMMLPEGTALRDLFKKKEWALVDERLKEELGPLAPICDRMKPFYVLALLMQGTGTGAGTTSEKKVLDVELQRLARDSDLVVMGIETVLEQLNAIDRISLKEQAALLLESVKQDGTSQGGMDAMLDAYARQDLDELMRVGAEGGMPMETNEALITARNGVMAHRTDSLMRTGKACFFAVGAAHLPGEEGVLERLMIMGWTVEPVISSCTRPRELPAVQEER